MECAGCELSIGSLTSRLPGGRRLKLIIITFIISNAGPDARAEGGRVHPTGTWGTWLVGGRRTVWRPKGRFFQGWDTICWLSLSDFTSSCYIKDFEKMILLTLDEDTPLQGYTNPHTHSTFTMHRIEKNHKSHTAVSENISGSLSTKLNNASLYNL